MSLKSGIVGLPNIGKSSLFNALLQSHQALSENYPFCTIEPNEGMVEVFDKRLIELAKINSSQKVVQTSINIIDIAGLVRGASKGLGLGNKFLDNVRSVDAIIHVVRCFDDKSVTHHETSIDPMRDIQIIENELILADLDRLEKLILKFEKNAKSNQKEIKQKLEIANKLKLHLESEKLAKNFDLSLDIFKSDHLDMITAKPVLFVANVLDKDLPKGNQYSDIVASYARENNCDCLVFSAKLESDLISISSIEEKKEYLLSYNLTEPCLHQLAKKSMELLNLLTFFTSGKKESRAWLINTKTRAQDAAGKIHTDISNGFIRAEVISYEDYIKHGSETAIKQNGLLRLEGKDYIVQDGDVINFLFNV